MKNYYPFIIIFVLATIVGESYFREIFHWIMATIGMLAVIFCIAYNWYNGKGKLL